MKIELENRILWYDGTNQIKPDLVPNMLLNNIPLTHIIVTETNDDIVKFNQLSDIEISDNKLKNNPFNMSWLVPATYLNINLQEFIFNKLSILKLSDEYNIRANNELQEIKIRGMEPLFKTLIYVIDRLKESGTIWGVGRGSSCASLVLFLIGLHQVDPVKYDIPMTEFFHN